MTNAAANRAEMRAAFLKAAGWGEAEARALAGDASTRSYERLTLGGERALLMNAPPAAESAPCPADAGPATRRALGYNAMARLAGPNLHAFMAISKNLRAAGLSAPEVLAANADQGFALIEDLGDDLYARIIGKGADETTLYETAVDALTVLHAARPSPPTSPQYTMLSYDLTALEAEIGLLIEWYWPHKKGAPPPQPVIAEYYDAWAGVLTLVSPPREIVLRDFHAENLLWLPGRRDIERAGIIDFQDGLIGSGAYDLVSLLEDARRDVDLDLAARMIKRYALGAAAQGPFDEAAFHRDYAALAAQRNAKILGIFARLVKRDGKPRYLEFMPRVEDHFRRDIARAPLAPVRAFFAEHFPDLAP
jgi:aminoglycoside/choline kinase family phosphotransferase